MTAAARPTWALAKGGNEARIFGSSQKYASRDLASRTTLKPRISRGKFTVVAITADDYLPMRSTEVNNRTSSSDIKSLRVTQGSKPPIGQMEDLILKHPFALNTALSQLGVVRPVFILPYVPLSLEKRVEFVRIVEAIGLENFVGQKEVRVLDDGDFVLVSRQLVPFVLLDLSAELVLMVRECLHMDSMFPGTEADKAGEVRPWAAAAIQQSNDEEYESII